MTLTVAELAARLNAACEGDTAVVIRRASSLRDAGEGDITFLSSARYSEQAARTRAGAIVVPEDWNGTCPAPARIRVPDPDAAFIRVAAFLAPPALPRPAPGIHPNALVAPDAILGAGASIGPFSVIEPGVRIGDGTVVGAQCYVGHGVTIGRDCFLYPQVSIREYCRIGDRTILHHGVVIGSDGFGYAPDSQKRWRKIPQVGVVTIGNDVEIGANTTVDRARFGETRIEDGVKLDNLVQVAHNVTIGAHSALAAQVGIAGSTRLGRHMTVGGQAGFAGHLDVGDGVAIGGQAGVIADIPAPGFYSGFPAIPHTQEMRRQVLLSRLPKLREQLAALEARLKKLEERPS